MVSPKQEHARVRHGPYRRRLMPEGHTIHRIARDHGKLLAGRPVLVSSPQGRFADDAARVDGEVLDGIEAYGKHLPYRHVFRD